MIVLDELAYAQNLLLNGSSKPYPILKDVVLLGKYWKYKGLETHEIKIKLEEYCKKTDKEWNKAISGWKITKAISATNQYRLRTTFPITVTKSEVETIKQFQDYSYQKVLFVLIVISKFLKYSNTKINPSKKLKVINEFFVNDEIQNIIKIAKISMRKAASNRMLHKFYLAGVLDGTTYNSLKIKCVNENSEPEILINDFSNLVLYWCRYSGEKIAGCSVCGKLFIKKSNRHAMCRSCFSEQRRAKKREYERRYRMERGQLETL